MKLMNISEPGSLRIRRFGTFFEVPRGAYVAVGDRMVILLCEFDTARNEYHDHYEVYLIQDAEGEDFQTPAAYQHDYEQALIGTLPIREIVFTPIDPGYCESPTLQAMVQRYLTSQ